MTHVYSAHTTCAAATCACAQGRFVWKKHGKPHLPGSSPSRGLEAKSKKLLAPEFRGESAGDDEKYVRSEFRKKMKIKIFLKSGRGVSYFMPSTVYVYMHDELSYDLSRLILQAVVVESHAGPGFGSSMQLLRPKSEKMLHQKRLLMYFPVSAFFSSSS